MKRIAILLAAIAVSAVAMLAVGCTTNDSHEHTYADDFACHDRTCTAEGCGHVEKATAAHTFADEFTCHDRTCSVCGDTEKATTEHTFGEWVTVREPGCETKGIKTRECGCGETEDEEIPATGHAYADDYTCHDRHCTSDGCDHVEAATTGHKYGDWTTEREPDCTQDGLKKRTCADCGYEDTETIPAEHAFDDKGVCTICKKSVKEFFVRSETGFATIAADAKTGRYTISGTESGDVYAVIPGNILAGLKTLGYTTLTVTATNPAPGLADNNSKVKPIKVAADDTANLWQAETAIAFYGWKEFWDAGKQITFTLDLATYAGRDIYLYTSATDVYPLELTVAEFLETEDKATWMLGSAADNGAVRYEEGKGWIMTPVSGSGNFWCLISGEMIKAKIAAGYTKMTIVYANNLEGDANTDAGDFVNTQSRIYPNRAGGGYISDYVTGYLNEYCTENKTTGYYEHAIDLTDARVDFTKDTYIYCEGGDRNKNAVTRGYIADLLFSSGDDGQENRSAWMTGNAGYNGAVRYEEGKGWIMTPVSGSGEFWCFISAGIVQKKIAAGYAKMTIVYANNLEGDANTDAGNFINTTSRIYPKRAGGGYIADYVSGYISQYCTRNETTGYYEHVVDLTDARVDFTQDIDVYCMGSDNTGAAVTRGYIADIVFTK